MIGRKLFVLLDMTMLRYCTFPISRVFGSSHILVSLGGLEPSHLDGFSF